MESVQGSWQYEAHSSANGTSYVSSPASPTLYDQLSPYADQGMWDDFDTKEDPFIGFGGEQLLSATGNAIIHAVSPLRVIPEMEVEGKVLPTLYVDPNLVQPLPIGDPTPVDLSDLEKFLGETLDFTPVIQVDETEAQEYVDVEPEPLNETSVQLGSPIAPEIKSSVDFDEFITIDAADLVPESELEDVLGNGQAINFDKWIMDQDEEAPNETTSFETSYEGSDSVMNDNSYLDSSSELSSALSSDAEDDAQEETINALMRFDLPAAKAAIVNSNFTIPHVATFVVEEIKPERRGRKPSSATSSKSWHNVKDKSLRKKQQNKLAATKYRQKKKEEAKVGMVEEAILQTQFSKLSQEQQRLADKIRQVKELLKEKYNL